MYYDMDFQVALEARVPKRDSQNNFHCMQFIMRLYNISQETKLDPGGVEHYSYMYSLGYDPRDQGWWVEEIKVCYLIAA